MTNPQFEEVESLLRRKNRCPTCKSKQIEVGPGVFDWPESTYKYDGKEIECNCQTQEDLYRHYLLARIPEAYMRLQGTDFFGDADAWNSTADYLHKWESFRDLGIGLGYYSKTQGTGKTLLATQVAKWLVKRGESVYYINFRDIVSLISKPYEARVEEENKIKESTLLVLDEVSKGVSVSQRDLFAEKFEELIRYRTNWNKITILTTNIEPDELDEEYPRTYSLLCAKEKRIKVNGNDSRRESIWDIDTELVENGEVRPIC